MNVACLPIRLLLLLAALVMMSQPTALANSDDRQATIRIGSKALAYWPYRFTTDSDADELMSLFSRVTASGLQLAFIDGTSP